MLDVLRLGNGPRVVLVHGSIVDGQRTWRKQLVLAERWALVIPNRPGFGESTPLERGDFDVEAPLIADLLGDGAHLVGHSYGAVIALVAAGLRPNAIHSLTVSEPGLLKLAANDPEGRQTLRNGDDLYRRRSELDPGQFLRLFRHGVHSSHETPDELPPELEKGARLAMRERAPWEAEPPLEAIANKEFPKLVISGDHSPTFEAVCDVLADRLKATRAHVTGRGHTIPATGTAYNELLERFLTAAEGKRRAHR